MKFAAALGATTALLTASCFSARPPIVQYRLVPPRATTAVEPSCRVGQAARRSSVVAIETFTAPTVYDDERIVYRDNPFALHHYHYHRWTSSPVSALRDYFQMALARGTMPWRVTTRSLDPSTTLIVGGAIREFDEVDTSEQKWVAVVQLELHVEDAASQRTLWSAQVDESQPLAERSPGGLAEAMSQALGRVSERLSNALSRFACREPPERDESIRRPR